MALSERGMKRNPVSVVEDQPIPDLGEVFAFMRLLWAVDHGLQSTSKRMAARLGITGPQRLVLRIVGHFPGIPAGQLAKILHVDKSTLTGVLKRLERADLIRRSTDPGDGRRALFGLTPRGKRLDIATEGTVESAVKATLERATRRELDCTRAVLTKLAVALDHSTERETTAAAAARND